MAAGSLTGDHRAHATRRAAMVSLSYNVILTIIKLIAAVITGSMSLLSEAVHSATDIVASAIAFFSVKMAALPPDEEHPYGHGKVESLAGFSESVLLLLIVVYILAEAGMRLIRGSTVDNLEVGIWVMAFSSVTSFLTGRYVARVGEETESLALRSNGQHLMVDFWTSVGVVAALLVTHLTGWGQADAVFAMGLALWIARGAWRLSREAFNELIDRRMADEEIVLIHEIVHSEPGVISYHRLRTRHSGHVHYIDLHIVVPNNWSVVHAHDLADRLEHRICEALAPAVVVIHVDPFDPTREDPA
jgi:cation diffusion facilitator family transporter